MSAAKHTLAGAERDALVEYERVTAPARAQYKLVIALVGAKRAAEAERDALADRLADMVCRASAALDFAFAEVPEGGCVPSVLTELEDSLRFARAALAKAGVQS